MIMIITNMINTVATIGIAINIGLESLLLSASASDSILFPSSVEPLICTYTCNLIYIYIYIYS